MFHELYAELLVFKVQKILWPLSNVVCILSEIWRLFGYSAGTCRVSIMLRLSSIVDLFYLDY